MGYFRSTSRSICQSFTRREFASARGCFLHGAQPLCLWPRTLPCTHSLIPQFTLLCAAGLLAGIADCIIPAHAHIHACNHILVILLPVQLQLCSILALRS